MRLLLIGLVITLSGISPRPHRAENDLARVNWAIANEDFLSASKYLANAGELYPYRYDLNRMAGLYALQAGEPQLAIQYLERPGTLSHLSNDDKVTLGDAYLQAGDALMAEAIWKSLVESNDSPVVRQRLLSLYQDRKDYDGIIAQLSGLIAFNPTDAALNYRIGKLYAAVDPMKALAYLDQAADLDPQNSPDARSLYDKIRTANLFDNQAYIYLIAGRQLANMEDWELAAIAFQNAIAHQPDYADAWAFLGEARFHLAVNDQRSLATAGLVELYQALQLNPDSILANTFMGLYWERQEKYSQAQPYLEHAIALSPDDPFLYSELGNVLSKAGDLPAAEFEYEAAIKANPQDPLFYRLLAQFALENRIQIRDIALPAARHALNLNPDDVNSLDLMGQVMLALQDYHSAERFLLTAVQTDPGYAPAYLHLGETYIYLEDPDSAREYLQNARSISPESWVDAQAKRMLEFYFP